MSTIKDINNKYLRRTVLLIAFIPGMLLECFILALAEFIDNTNRWFKLFPKVWKGNT